MAKFVYKMQSLLNIKEKLEEQEKTAYGLARMQLTEEEEKLYELQTKRAYYVEQKRLAMSSAIKVTELARTEQAIRSTDIMIEEQQAVVAKARRILEAARIRLENAMKERKIQEKLKEKALDVFKQELEAEEQKEINELVTFRHGNRQERQE
ncbi:MAG: flagellar export protein FliJ [Lachnospiraceae bacterium]